MISLPKQNRENQSKIPSIEGLQPKQIERTRRMINDAVYQKLIQVAKTRKTLAYSELAHVADVLIEGDDDYKSVGFILDAIADQEVAAGRPLLPIVVVSGRTNMPGGGLFKYAKRKKLQKGDDLTFFAMELNRVYDFWAKQP